MSQLMFPINFVGWSISGLVATVIINLTFKYLKRSIVREFYYRGMNFFKIIFRLRTLQLFQ